MEDPPYTEGVQPPVAPQQPVAHQPQAGESVSMSPAPDAFSQAVAPPVEAVPVAQATPEPITPAPETPVAAPPIVDVAQEDTPVEETKKPMRLGEKLVSLGLLAQDQLEIALRDQRESGKLLGALLVELNFITESALSEVLAESTGTERFDPQGTVVDPNLLALVPKEVCVRHKIIPISQEEDGGVRVAMADVYNVLAIDQIRRYLDKSAQIIPLYSNEGEISEQIDQYYDYEMSIDGILREIETGIRDNTQLDGTEEGYVNPTVRLVNSLLVDSVKQGASDIHFEPEGTFLRLRYRIDGKLQQIRSFHRDYWSAMLVRLKIISGMNIAETRSAQDGRINFKVAGREVDFRVATQPTVHGENVVLRLLDKSKALMTMDTLGFSEHNLSTLKRCLKRPEGVIIVTGPTGSGKTTTLYSVLSYINSIDVNIMTLEDPVEYQLPLIRQTNVKEGIIDFSSGIKSLMRQDPDIVFIGEVRDEETAIMAVRAALTGHQVYTTLHTNDAMGAIPRLGDIGVPAHMLAGSLICALAQRLTRRLCSKCKEPYVATAEDCQVLGEDPHNPPTIYKAVGCDACAHKGYKGRLGIHEILRIDSGLDELISTHATRNQMMAYALENGFVPMWMDGAEKVKAGLLDIPELINKVDLTDRLA